MDMQTYTLKELPVLTRKAFQEALPSMGLSQRRAQIEYAEHVAEVLSAGRGASDKQGRLGQTGIGLIEAGTGVGKTLGYLIPAALFNQITGLRVGISTHTLALQDQMWGEAARTAGRAPDWSHPEDRGVDLAITREAVRRLGFGDVDVCFIRARKAYVDVSRAMALIKDMTADDPTLANDQDWSAFMRWVNDVRDAKPGVSGLFKDAYAIPAGLAASELWIENPDPDVHLNPYYAQSRLGSRNAGIVLHTHAMALINAHTWHKILEDDLPMSVTIFDEADQLESMGEALSSRRMRPRTLRNQIQHQLSRTDNGWSAPTRAKAESLIGLCKEGIKFLDSVLEAHLDAERSGHEEARTLAFPFDVDTQEASRALYHLKSIAAGIEALDKSTGGQFEHPAEDWRRAAAAFDTGTTAETICALSFTPVNKWGAFQVRDMYPARLIGRSWARSKQALGDDDSPMDSHHESIIFTSATLTNDALDDKDRFQLFKISLGLSDRNNRMLKQVVVEPAAGYGVLEHLYLPVPMHAKTLKFEPWPAIFTKGSSEGEETHGAPESRPDIQLNPEWLERVAQTLVHVQKAASDKGQSSLILTGSYSETEQLLNTVNRLGLPLDALWHLEHGYDQLGELLGAVRCAPAGKLLVTPAAWQGISLEGAQNTQIMGDVVITRSPYPPFDAVRLLGHLKRNQALASLGVADLKPKQELEKYERSRSRYIAYCKTRQGMGRLVRHHTHRGNIWILDPRVAALTDLKKLGFLHDDPALEKVARRNGNGVSDPRYWLVRAIPKRFDLYSESNPHCVRLLTLNKHSVDVYEPNVLNPSAMSI